jgi:hypothetical protein
MEVAISEIFEAPDTLNADFFNKYALKAFLIDCEVHRQINTSDTLQE